MSDKAKNINVHSRFQKIPVGTDAFVASRVRERVAKLQKVTNKLSDFEDTHVEFTLLRACLGSTKLAYILRGVAPSAEVMAACQEADETTRLELERILGVGLDSTAWTQAGLKPSWGGLGIRHCCDVSIPAFWLRCRHRCAHDANAWQGQSCHPRACLDRAVIHRSSTT